ncbi:MAG: hypothetical protein CMH56_08705 [Myxococcales bacterium]|nr:hypothetical protein [Myxococcales bacterium]
MSQLRDKIAKRQKEILLGLVRGDAKNNEWLDQNFKWAYEGFILNRIVPDNIERIKAILADCFPNHAAHAPLDQNSIALFCSAIKTTGSEVECLDHYFSAVQNAMQTQPADSAARDALFLDWAHARVKAQEAITPKALSDFIQNLPPDAMNDEAYIVHPGLVIIQCLTNLIHFLDAPFFTVDIAVENPGNKPYALIYKTSAHTDNKCIRFSSIAGLKFQNTFAD